MPSALLGVDRIGIDAQIYFAGGLDCIAETLLGFRQTFAERPLLLRRVTVGVAAFVMQNVMGDVVGVVKPVGIYDASVDKVGKCLVSLGFRAFRR